MRATNWMLGVVLVMASAVAASQEPGAEPVGLRGDIGGLWFDPGADGQGLQIDVLDGGRAAVTWYTYDANGAPLWLFGLGRIDGNAIEAEMGSASGGRFPTIAAQTPPTFQTRGVLRVEFMGCDAARLEYDDQAGGLPDGSGELQRLSRPQGVRCNAEEEFSEQRVLSFELGENAFYPIFADLPADGHDIYELDFDWKRLPEPLQARRGLFLAGHNRSDDLAMMIAAPLGGLQPEQLYQVELEVEFATQVPAGCIGVGGSPGEGVYVKLGALDFAPQATVVDEGGFPTLRPNFDFGNQSEGGAQALVVGDLANTQQCDGVPEGEWELKTLSTQGRAFRVRSDAQGRMWVVAGTDSAFEGLTHVYYTSLRVRLRPIEAS
ncbi:hypothetical protein [Pseudomarimonas salicorniae]|uniref:Uncharacterized protein n=1 Tax=Pseudomarimonas salicorniae TaxID=2933270 RepID=A0ABT0GC97_9GAMM|nr:hypothetical protein [Lysobacter sp. CAU 1642]MCK7592145.1 hypothetical protein [Lysobacter sp. CAU 1642]